MLAHRFRELLEASESIPTAMITANSTAFVPCPIAYAISPIQQAQVEYLYRLAFDHAQAQVAAARRRRWQGYSLN
jgi:hypothetical protein